MPSISQNISSDQYTVAPLVEKRRIAWFYKSPDFCLKAELTKDRNIRLHKVRIDKRVHLRMGLLLLFKRNADDNSN